VPAEKTIEVARPNSQPFGQRFDAGVVECAGSDQAHGAMHGCA
jgi:hypothetical protein